MGWIFDSMKPEYDYEKITRPTKCYALVSEARTGGVNIQRGLWETGIAGKPASYYEVQHMDNLYYPFRIGGGISIPGHTAFIQLKRTGPNGVFGVCLTSVEMYRFLNSKPSVFSNVFPSMDFIYLYRHDLLRQAISLSKAWMTGMWGYDDTPKGGLQYNAKTIERALSYVAKAGDYLKVIMPSFEPLTLVYEEYIKDYEGTIKKILEFLEIEIPEDFHIEPPMKKQADAQSEEWYGKAIEGIGRGEIEIPGEIDGEFPLTNYR